MSAVSGADRPTVVLVPGAWMGAWIWGTVAANLRASGLRVRTPTLSGLRDGAPSTVTLADHVAELVDLLRAEQAPCVLVAHSYSGVVVGQAADRCPDLVTHSVHVASFLPRDGRSLLDDWGADPDERAAERQQVHDDGMLWAAPPAAALAHEPDLTPPARAWLADGFVPHPGRTVLDPAVMHRPITAQSLTFVATAPDGADPHADLPPEFADGTPPAWRLRTFTSGHWPMTSRPDALTTLLAEETGER